MWLTYITRLTTKMAQFNVGHPHMQMHHMEKYVDFMVHVQLKQGIGAASGNTVFRPESIVLESDRSHFPNHISRKTMNLYIALEQRFIDELNLFFFVRSFLLPDFNGKSDHEPPKTCRISLYLA